MARLLVTATVLAACVACDLDASAKDYLRRSCALRCAGAAEACQRRCEDRLEAPWKAWLVRVEAVGFESGPARVTLERRDGPTGAVDDARVLNTDDTAWPATDQELRLSRSDDGRGIALLGYAVDGGTGAVAEDATALRLGWLTSTGVDWVATLPAPRTNITAAATGRGDSFWVAGPNSFGLQEVRRGEASASARLQLVSGENVRALAVRGGALFGATPQVLRSFPLPAGSGPSTIELQSTNITDFELVDLEDTIPGADTLYLTRGQRQPGLTKYVRRAGTWQLAWEASAALTVDDPTTCQSLAVLVRRPAAIVLCVQGDGGRMVVRFDDDPATLGAGAPVPSSFAIAPAPASFRGIALVPEGS